MSEDIAFLESGCTSALTRNPEPGEQIDVHATIHYAHAGPEDPHDVVVELVEHLPVGSSLVATTIFTSAPQTLNPAGGTFSLCIPWTPTTAGTRISLRRSNTAVR